MGSVKHNGTIDKPRRVALYARVSTEDQAERGTIDAQLTFLRNFCQLYGLDVAGEYLDDGTSGTVPLADRPEGRRLLDDAQAKRFGEVIAYRLDRLGRTLKTLLDAREQLDRLGVTIRSATEPFDTSTSIGTFLFQLLASLAELERKTIAERMGMGRDRVARDGKWTGGPIPLGYDVDAAGKLVESVREVIAVSTDGARIPVALDGADGLFLAPGERPITEAELVRSIFRRVAAGGSAIGECVRLNTLGVPCSSRYAPRKKAPKSQKEREGPRRPHQATRITRTAEGTEVVVSGLWQDSRLLQMLHNPLYKGTGRLGSRAGTIERPAPALVDDDLWGRASNQLARNKTLATRNARHFFPLRGLITCGTCGKTYIGYTAFPGSPTGGRPRRYYRCRGMNDGHKPADQRCTSPSIRADQIERDVWEGCVWFIEHPDEGVDEARRQLRDRLAQATNNEERRRALLADIAEKATERERVMTMFRRGRIALDVADRQLEEIAREEGQLRGQLEALRAQDELAAALEAQVAGTMTALGQFRGRLAAIEQADDWHARREMIERLVVGITVSVTGEGDERRVEVTPTYAYSAPGARRESAADPNRVSPGGKPWRRPGSSCRSGASTDGSG